MPLIAAGDFMNPLWSHARAGTTNLNMLASAGSFTTGVQFHVDRPGITCVGLRFFGVASAAKTVKCKLYDAAGTLLASALFAISANGSYEVSWTSPIALTAFALYRVCTWQNDGLNYYVYTGANSNPPARPFPAGGVVVYNSLALFLAGDTAPTTAAAAEQYPVEPILGLQ